MNGRVTRGEIDCGDVITGLSTQSGHCLRLDDLWYAVFDLEPPIMEYEINVFVTVNNKTEIVSLSHTDIVGQTSDNLVVGGVSKHVIAELIGDFAGAQATPLYEDKYLVVPATPGHHLFNVSGDMLANAMLISKTAFDFTGTTCDKIGVSHAAFVNQPQRCTRRAHECLGFQLSYYHDIDLDRELKGKKKQYMLSEFCDGEFQLDSEKNEDTQKNDYTIRCPIKTRHTTMIRLEIAADDMRFITNLASGIIDSMYVEDFEAMSGAGQIVTTVNSTGQRPAEFLLAAECTDGVIPGPVPRFSLAPGMQDTKLIQLSSTSIEGSALNCTVALEDVHGTQLDMRTVEFAITQMEQDCGAQCGETEGEEEGLQTIYIAPDNTCQCAWYAIWCHFLYLKLCHKKLMMALALYGGAPLLLYLTYVGKLSFLCRLCKRRQSTVREVLQKRQSHYQEPHGYSKNDRTPYSEKVRRQSRRSRYDSMCDERRRSSTYSRRSSSYSRA